VRIWCEFEQIIFTLKNTCPRDAPGIDREIAAAGMAQERQAHGGQEVFVAGVAGVGAQVIGGTPEKFFDGFNRRLPLPRHPHQYPEVRSPRTRCAGHS